MQKAAGAIGEMLALEELASGHTVIHRFHPLSKLIVTLIYVVTVISAGRLDFFTLSLFFFYPAVLLALSETPVRAVLKRIWVALPFVLFAGLSNILLEKAMHLVILGIPISRGVVSFAVLLEKTILTAGAVLILMATTRMAQVFSCLRRLGMPRILLTVLLLCLRYLSLLAGEAGRMVRAYHLRSVRPRGIQMKDMGSFVGQLLLRSMNQAERVYQAMKLRGFDGGFAMLDTGRMDIKSACYAVITSALILLCRFLPASGLFGFLR